MRCYQRWRLVGLSFVKDHRSARLMDIVILCPFLISSGILYPILPWNVRISFITGGIMVGLWNVIAIFIEDRK